MHPSVIAIVLSATSAAMAGHLMPRSPAHHAIAARSEAEAPVKKRFFTDSMTWYPNDTGGDFCTGRNHGDYDNIVAMNTAQFGNGAACGKKIRITSGGKSAIGVVQDLCPTCGGGPTIDVTKGLFLKFANNLGQGVVSVNWEFVDGDAEEPEPPKPPKPTPPAPKPPAPKPPTPKPPAPKPPAAKPPAPKPPKSSSIVVPPKPSSSSRASSSSISISIPRPSSSSTLAPISTPVVLPSEPVANVGGDAEPSESADIIGGISSDGLNGNGAASLGVSSLIALGAGLLVVAQLM